MLRNMISLQPRNLRHGRESQVGRGPQFKLLGCFTLLVHPRLLLNDGSVHMIMIIAIVIIIVVIIVIIVRVRVVVVLVLVLSIIVIIILVRISIMISTIISTEVIIIILIIVVISIIMTGILVIMEGRSRCMSVVSADMLTRVLPELRHYRHECQCAHEGSSTAMCVVFEFNVVRSRRLKCGSLGSDPADMSGVICAVMECRHTASSRCSARDGPYCPRHGCDCGNHEGASQRRVARGRGSQIQNRVRSFQRILAVKVKRVQAALQISSHMTQSELVDHILWTYRDADEVVDEGVFYKGPLIGVPAALLKRTVITLKRYRLRHAEHRRREFSDSQWSEYRSLALWWQKDDDREVAALSEEDAALLTQQHHDDAESEDDWGDWKWEDWTAWEHRPSASWNWSADAAQEWTWSWDWSSTQGRAWWCADDESSSESGDEVETSPRSRSPLPRRRYPREDDEDGDLFNLTSPSAWLPDGEIARNYRPAAGPGRFCWDVGSQKPRAHVNRSVGPYQPTSIQCGVPHQLDPKHWNYRPDEHTRDLRFDAAAEGYTSYRHAQKFLLSWMSARNLLREIASIEAFSRYPFRDAAMFEGGRWLYMQMKGAPHPLRHAPPPNRRWGFHGTSMYCVSRALQGKSLTTGMARLTIGGSDVKGVFYHIEESSRLCQQTYMLYSAFNKGPFIFGPLIVLAADTEPCVDGVSKKSVAKRKGGVDQHLTYAGCHEIVGVAFNIVHIAEVLALPKASWLNLEISWLPELELGGLHFTWDDILAESTAKKAVDPKLDA